MLSSGSTVSAEDRVDVDRGLRPFAKVLNIPHILLERRATDDASLFCLRDEELKVLQVSHEELKTILAGGVAVEESVQASKAVGSGEICRLLQEYPIFE